ncbi:hypothetical protein PF005_g13978 [Phytophthora fragariae]|uniref:Uncharacterized protein n=1 Tax=Phytophthora fragariae TaxID=53985 RepID=A0A6A3XK34_9STRA|nr:hypothetical protein PF009_g15078 [Phytophthora fragariae]KAE9007111.1 hypothetical protein PF011_g11278 [Phytophthora fragariae]KAE9103604.1 hypothetical protein PF010_g13675 [Phytophthora fragariae]KAE9104842.1 hypothetical protein PF007_g13913 [Phytophthora fragariae]KAE9203973.1 hypothetical protein PF005_g13978 [Phytophthora fragariae]
MARLLGTTRSISSCGLERGENMRRLTRDLKALFFSEFKKNLPRKPSPDCPPLPQADLKSGRERFCDSDSSGSSYKQKETPTTKPELTSDTPPKSKQALAPTPDQTRPVNLWKKIRAKLSTRPAPSSHQRGFFKVIQRCFGGRNKIPRYKPSFLPTAELCDLIVRSFDNAILVA